MSTRRITVEEVLEAYRVKGLEPDDSEYRCGTCACGIGAISPFEFDSDIHHWANMEFGQEYRVGFIHGFERGRTKKAKWIDMVATGATDRKRYNLGFADGQAVAAAVFQKQGAQA